MDNVWFVTILTLMAILILYVGIFIGVVVGIILT